jgi:hypothetical protein
LVKHCSIKNCKQLVHAKSLCENHYSQDWAKKNPTKIKVNKKRYYEINRLEILKRVEEYQEKNFKKIQKQHREYYLENRSRILKLRKERYWNSK